MKGGSGSLLVERSGISLAQCDEVIEEVAAEFYGDRKFTRVRTTVVDRGEDVHYRWKMVVEFDDAGDERSLDWWERLGKNVPSNLDVPGRAAVEVERMTFTNSIPEAEKFLYGSTGMNRHVHMSGPRGTSVSFPLKDGFIRVRKGEHIIRMSDGTVKTSVAGPQGREW